MLFNSYTFLFLFLPITLALVLGASALGLRRTAKVSLLVASLFFYGWANPRYLIVLGALVAFNYGICRLLMADAGDDGRRKAVFILGVVANVATLAYFKYTNFTVTTVDELFGWQLRVARIALPLGLSFITFQKIALLVDVYDRSVTSFGLLDYCLFVTFFPQLIAGPIVHHREVFPQLADPKTLHYSADGFAAGIALFCIGFFKKAMLADSVASLAGRVFDGAAHGQHQGAPMLWLGAVAYTLQLYFDFSGYCDMAIGLGRLFGIRLPINFDSPFKATNIIDFWRRWHMTLTRFLTACIYNPILLAINRRRAAQGLSSGRRGMTLPAFTQLVVLPTMVTMCIAGIWHGAGFQFAVFGALHGLYLVCNHAWRTFGKKRKASPRFDIPKTAGTFLLVVVAFVFFRADSVHTALRMLGEMTGLHGPNPRPQLTSIAGTVVLAAIAFAAPNSNRVVDGAAGEASRWWDFRPSLAWGLCIGAIALAAMLQLDASTEFLYFNF